MAWFVKGQLGSETDKTLWHYTSNVATVSIIESKKLWATGIRYLNDSSEFRSQRTALTNWGKKAELSALEKRFLQVLLEAIDNWAINWSLLGTFVASFSETCNDLSQWRAYGAEGGFCLGFAQSDLERLAEAQGFRLVRCLYDASDQVNFLSPLVSEALEKFRAIAEEHSINEELVENATKASGTGVQYAIWHLGQDFFNKLLETACHLKDDSFKNEAEWRLVSTRKEGRQVKFRANRSMLIPYVEVDLASTDNPLRLRSIISGPSPHQRENHAAVAYLCGVNSVHVDGYTSCALPFRNW